MNIFKRLKNLWKLSELDYILPHELQPKESKHVRLVKQATIVDLSDDVELE